MCNGCYQKYGAPNKVTPEIKEAARLIALVYKESCVGGNLHIVVDDWNLEDEKLSFCKQAIEDNCHEHDPRQQDVERRCLAALEALDVTGRATALAINDGFLEEDFPSPAPDLPVSPPAHSAS